MSQSKARPTFQGGTVTSREDDREGWGVPDEAGAYRWEAIPWKKLAAVVVWCVGVYCTSLVAARLFDSALLVWVAAVIAQGVLTFLESPIWRRRTHDGGDKRPLTVLSLVALALDAAFNLVGTWALVAKLHTFDFVQVVGEMFGVEAVEPLTGMPAFVLCVVLAVLLCSIPERLYFDEQ